VLALRGVIACDSDTDDNQFREDVISCEEAVARLEECCPGFRPTRVACRYYFHRREGCEGSGVDKTEPDLDLRESQCVREASCEKLASQGFCDRDINPPQGVARPRCF
jgi:hypothetical protein